MEQKSGAGFNIHCSNKFIEEEKGGIVIYNDTDSSYCRFPQFDDKSVKEFLEYSKQLTIDIQPHGCANFSKITKVDIKFVMGNDISKKIPKILLVGKKGVGKTTTMKRIAELVPGTVMLAIAKPLKDADKAVFLLTDEQLYDEKMKEEIDPRWGVTPRRLMQGVGDLFRDYLSVVIPELKLDKGLIFTQNLYWRLKELDEMKENRPPLIVIEDGRLADEHKFFKTYSEGISVEIQRDTGSTDNHISEQIPFSCDVKIDNNGSINNLFNQIDTIIDMISQLVEK
jgi:energy-coupling factor transporter ATP-binding protein EcfA2